jgi:hypothetical protein
VTTVRRAVGIGCPSSSLLLTVLRVPLGVHGYAVEVELLIAACAREGFGDPVEQGLMLGTSHELDLHTAPGLPEGGLHDAVSLAKLQAHLGRAALLPDLQSQHALILQ